MTRLGVILALFLAANAHGAGFVVTNTNDDGAGSLRQAIVDANASPSCESETCTITFAIEEPLPPSGWYVIAPQIALPPITAPNVAVLGPALSNAPAVEISGEHFTGYTAVIELRGNCSATVSGLAIVNSSGPGLLFGGSASHCASGVRYVDIAGNDIGVDPTGMNAAPNERGIVDGPGAIVASIRGNVISGNRRSGIFLTNGFTSARIVGNLIGTDAQFDAIGNGATGIFTVGRAVIESDVVAYNRDFGIASAGNVEIIGTPIFGNGLTAISTFLQLGNAGPAVVIDSASAHEVTGHVRSLSLLEPASLVTLYSSFGLGLAGYGEGEVIVGAAQVGNDGRFVIRTANDLSGRYLTAFETRSTFDPDHPLGATTRRSSLLSAPFHVLP